MGWTVTVLPVDGAGAWTAASPRHTYFLEAENTPQFFIGDLVAARGGWPVRASAADKIIGVVIGVGDTLPITADWHAAYTRELAAAQAAAP